MLERSSSIFNTKKAPLGSGALFGNFRADLVMPPLIDGRREADL